MRRITFLICSSLIFILFFNGYKAEGPSRKKFKVLGEGEIVDLTKEEVVRETDPLKEIAKDKRFKPWVSWWQKCKPDLNINTMENIGLSPIYDETIPYITPSEMGEGPASDFYQRSPGGKYHLNPYFRRLQYKKEGEAWQPYIQIPCGVAVYTSSEKKGRNVLDCSALEGVDDAFWAGKDRFVLMGYTSVSRQMNVECETVESCASPTIWIVDLKTGLVNEHGGGLIKRKSCELGGYLKTKLPKFFGKEEKPK